VSHPGSDADDFDTRLWEEQRDRVIDKNHLPPELAARILEREAELRANPLGADVAEIATVLSEECAEAAVELMKVVQRCTKILRFGLTVNPWTGVHNRDAIELELGDVVAMIRALHANQVIDLERVSTCADRKLEALRRPDGRLRIAKIPEDA